MTAQRQSGEGMVPWALSRVSAFGELEPAAYEQIELDPQTQTARYRTADGGLIDPIEAGKHGTIQNTYKPYRTGKDGKTDTDTEQDAQRD
jgi:putative ATP-grasp target RiPP